jgi:hypothetical protein
VLLPRPDKTILVFEMKFSRAVESSFQQIPKRGICWKLYLDLFREGAVRSIFRACRGRQPFDAETDADHGFSARRIRDVTVEKTRVAVDTAFWSVQAHAFVEPTTAESGPPNASLLFWLGDYDFEERVESHGCS